MLARTGSLKSSLLGPFAFSAVVGLILLLCGCRGVGSGEAKTGKMGERVQVGPLIYSVLEADWKSTIGDPPEIKYPKNKFLIVRLTVTNSGASESGIPHMTLEDARGNSYPEGVDGQSIPEWLPVLRRVKPAETEQGRIYFDAPPASYRLRIMNDADSGQEKIAFIEIPLQLEPEAPASLPPAPVPTEPDRK